MASISPLDISAYYRIYEKEETFNTRWISEFPVANNDILKSWRQEPSRLWVKADQVYKIDGMRKVHQLMATMMNWLYGRPNVDTFLET